MTLHLLLFFLALLPFVQSQCGLGFFSPINGGLTSLSDLRISTPLTYIASYSVVSCATEPAAVSISYTLSVDGTLFFAPLEVFTASADGVSFATYGFEDLIITRLVPGEVLLGALEVELALLDGSSPPIAGIETFQLQVPSSITLVPAATGTAPTPTPTGTENPGSGAGGDTSVQPTRTTTSIITVPATSPASSTNTKSSVPVGGIVGGVIGAAVALTALAALAWYKTRKRRDSGLYFGGGGKGGGSPEARSPPPPPPPQGQQQPVPLRTLGRGNEGQPEEDWMRYYPNLRQGRGMYE